MECMGNICEHSIKRRMYLPILHSKARILRATWCFSMLCFDPAPQYVSQKALIISLTVYTNPALICSPTKTPKHCEALSVKDQKRSPRESPSSSAQATGARSCRKADLASPSPRRDVSVYPTWYFPPLPVGLKRTIWTLRVSEIVQANPCRCYMSCNFVVPLFKGNLNMSPFRILMQIASPEIAITIHRKSRQNCFNKKGLMHFRMFRLWVG